jgi:hypothetical protein
MKVLKFVFLVLLGFSGVMLRAQDALVVSDRQWKSQGDASNIISQEVAQKNQVLASPNLPHEDRILFTSYVRVLELTNVDLQNSKPVSESLMLAFKQVVVASTTDPVTKGLVSTQLADLMIPLIEHLSALPQVTPQVGQ